MSQSPRPRYRATSPGLRSPLPGPHELGQNWLVDHRVAAEIAEILRHAPPHPILELAAGNGAITEALVARRLPVTAIEIDSRCARRLTRRFAGRAEIIEADMLDFDLDVAPHHVVANVPFSLTTPLLRRLVQQTTWDTAVLLLQWEVARKRAGVGGTTMLTASWWPWYEFSLVKRVPATAFAPRPSVDGGILLIRRRQTPLVSTQARKPYQQLVRVAFTGRGRGLPAILRNLLGERAVRDWMVQESLDKTSLPRDLKAEQWASLHRLDHRSSGR
jgi:23S rRNA (adenine-N6)-dimethyltransferase